MKIQAASDNAPQQAPATLGEVLYAKPLHAPSEEEWVGLVRSIARGDQLALHTLYERSHRIVFTLLMRLTANWETAEELTVDVFYDVWRGACRYDSARGTVLAWIMNQARSRAIDRLRFENRKKRTYGGGMVASEELADPRDLLRLQEQRASLHTALSVLAEEERAAIEAIFIAGLNQADAALRLQAPLATVKTRTRTALAKLREALGAIQ